MLNLHQRITIFNTIRDIPYVISATSGNATCAVKSKLLGHILSLHGMESRIMRCQFSWRDQPIPRSILNQLSDSKVPLHAPHTFLQTRIPETNEFVTIDPTWDSALNAIFVTNHWDGLSSTQLAVSKPTSITTHELSNFQPGIPPLNDPFLASFNQWLINIRKDQHDKTT